MFLGIPLPVIFLSLWMGSAATDSAAVYIFLFFVSIGLGFIIGLVLLVLLLMYRRRWHRRLRDRLAADGITAREVSWFDAELSTEERRAWREMEANNPLLADAYCETLATKINATRIKTRVHGELLRLNKQINRAGRLRSTDRLELIEELNADRARIASIYDEAGTRLSTAKAHLQMIEAAANRDLTHRETEVMLQRLVNSQNHLPLIIEISKLEAEALLDLKENL